MQSLFPQDDESASKSVISEQINAETNSSINTGIQQSTQTTIEIPAQTLNSNHEPPIQIQQIEIPGKTVRKIIVYYSDNTFQEFQ